MKEAFIIAVLAGLGVVGLGLDGCAPGTVIWTIPAPRVSSRQMDRHEAPAASEALTQDDRAALSRLLAKINKGE